MGPLGAPGGPLEPCWLPGSCWLLLGPAGSSWVLLAPWLLLTSKQRGNSHMRWSCSASSRFYAFPAPICSRQFPFCLGYMGAFWCISLGFPMLEGTDCGNCLDLGSSSSGSSSGSSSSQIIQPPAASLDSHAFGNFQSFALQGASLYFLLGGNEVAPLPLLYSTPPGSECPSC
jgi:hypothetical protein